MSPETRFATLAACVYLPLGLGYAARTPALVRAETSKCISRTTLVTLEPITVLAGCWLLGVASVGGAAIVPVAGALVSLGLLGVAAVGASLLGLRGARRLCSVRHWRRAACLRPRCSGAGRLGGCCSPSCY